MNPIAEVQNNLTGMLVVNKPRGMVSKDVSRWLEKRLGKVKLGHVGTLDPMAEGVLPVLIGRATRLQDFLLDSEKAYEFDITFGVTTTTLDADGEVVATAPHEHINAEELHKICQDLEGAFWQVPPLYSAIKYQGKPLYRYAREGGADKIPFENLGKHVQIHSLKLQTYHASIGKFLVVCSKGTYVRTLAAKISEKAGSCGMVSRLKRIKASGVEISQSHSLSELEEADLANLVVPIRGLDLGMPTLKFSLPRIRRLLNGQPVQLEEDDFPALAQVDNGSSLLIVSTEGEAIGLAVAYKKGDGVQVKLRRGLL